MHNIARTYGVLRMRVVMIGNLVGDLGFARLLD